MRTGKGLVCLMAVMAITVPLHAQDSTPKKRDAEKEKAVRQLLEMTGASKLALQVMDQMLVSMKQAMPNVPDEFWTRFRKKIKSDDLTNQIAPIYGKYYTKDDLKQIIAFYNTPIGRKMIAVTPQISRESMTVGQEWGRKLGEEAVQEMKQEGYAPPQ